MNKHPNSFRLTETARELIDRLAVCLGLSKTGVIEIAVREMAKRELHSDKQKSNNVRA